MGAKELLLSHMMQVIRATLSSMNNQDKNQIWVSELSATFYYKKWGLGNYFELVFLKNGLCLSYLLAFIDHTSPSHVKLRPLSFV